MLSIWLTRAAVAIVATVIIYGLIALLLIASEAPSAPKPVGAGLDMSAAVGADYRNLPSPQSFTARDGTNLPYRLYGDPAEARRTILLLHGSGWHGMQFHPMATALAREPGNLVIAPDLRGHGANPTRRGDVGYIGQLEDDLADLIGHIPALAPGSSIIVGGHSSGGGLVVRFAGGAYGKMADGFVLIAPFLGHSAPTTRPNSGGWAHPAIRRIIGLTMLGRVGISAFDGLPVIAFAMPQTVLDGPYGSTVTTQYSYRLNTSYAPRSDFGADLAAIDQPFLLLAGTADEAFDAARYEETIAARTSTGTFRLLDGVGHIGIVTDPDVASTIAAWLAEAFS